MREEKADMQMDIEIPCRFSVQQRIEHFFLAVLFISLSITGLVQKYALNSFSERLISLMGGFEQTRLIHRCAALLFTLLAAYHLLKLGYIFFVCRVRMTMWPGLQDVKDGLHSLGYSLFLRKNPPQMPRYNFAEKIEYWALIWGSLIMIVTGFILWNPLTTSLLLPGQIIPAAKAAHGSEAVLAVLAIIVWHFYHVHIKIFNKSMFTGRMTRCQMEEEHGAEWSDLAAENPSIPSLPSSIRRRRLIFIPIAAAFVTLAAAGTYWASTVGTAAISSLPITKSPNEIYNIPITLQKITKKIEKTKGLPDGLKTELSAGIPGHQSSIGVPADGTMALLKKIFSSWMESPHLDNIHRKQGASCSSCHGKELPLADATVENPRCIACHGSYEKLAAKTIPKQFVERNPHKNHFVHDDIECNLCHKAHDESKAYCLDCHQNFDMKIP